MQRKQAMWRMARVVVAAVVVLAAGMVMAWRVAANGNGVTVYLGYLPEVSNWGPYEATGQAYVNAGEGRAHVTVDHMIDDSAMRYEVWLVRADDRNSLFSMGTFEVDGSGHADVELLNPDLRPAEFRFLVISAEPANDDDPAPDARRTVAGVFPNTMARAPMGGAGGLDDIWGLAPVEGAGASPSPTTTPPAAGAVQGAGGAPPAPPRLPVTGARPPAPLPVVLGVAAAASVGLMVAGARRQRAAARVRQELARGGSR